MKYRNRQCMHFSFGVGGLLSAVSPALAITVTYSAAGKFSTSGTNDLSGTGTNGVCDV